VVGLCGELAGVGGRFKSEQNTRSDSPDW